MAEPSTTQARRLRAWSMMGDIRRVPTEYEIGSHDLNPSTRKNRNSPLELNPSSPVNLWFTTYRDRSAVQLDDWHQFRDPDQMTYRKYVALQEEEEAFVNGALDEYSEAGHDRSVPGEWIDALALLFVPTRFMIHGLQMTQMYIAGMAPSSYITYCASFSAGDLLRRGSLVAYRTREMQLALPDKAALAAGRDTWEMHPAWQATRKLVEQSLIAYDWAESFTAVNLVIRPALDTLLLERLSDRAREHEDELSWMLLRNLLKDSERARRWSLALARYASGRNPANAAVIAGWMDKWQSRAAPAVEGLASLLASTGRPGAQTAPALAAAAMQCVASIARSAGIPVERSAG